MDKDKDRTPSECTTIGYVMKETDNYVVIAQSLDEKGDPCNIVVIPKVAIHV